MFGSWQAPAKHEEFECAATVHLGLTSVDDVR